MTVPTARTTPYTSDSADPPDWRALRNLVEMEVRSAEKSRPAPRLAIGVKLSVLTSLVPKHADPKSHLKKMLRKSLYRHGIPLYGDDIYIGDFHDGIQRIKNVELEIKWGRALPEREFEGMMQLSQKFEESMQRFRKNSLDLVNGSHA